MKCYKCGADLDDNSRFCIVCGTHVVNENNEPDKSEAPGEVHGLKMSGSLAMSQNIAGQGQKEQNQQTSSALTENKQDAGNTVITQNPPLEQPVKIIEKTSQTVSVKNSRIITPVNRQENVVPMSSSTSAAPTPKVSPVTQQPVVPPVKPVIPQQPAVPPVIPVTPPPPVRPIPSPIASCMRCGASIPADKIYCDRCSIIEEGGGDDGDKSHFGIIIGIIIGALVLILGGIAFAFRDKIGGLFTGDSSESSDFDTVHSELLELVEDEAFQASDADGRRDMAMDVIDSLDEQKLVDGDSVVDSDDSYLYFELSDGTECIIELESPENNDYLGSPAASDSSRHNSVSSRLMTYPEDISELSDPFVEGERSALIIDGTDDEAINKELAEYAGDWSECHLDSEVVSDFTVEAFRTKLGSYDYVNIFCHGILLESSNSLYIRTSEEISVKSMEKYSEDASSRRIALGYFPGKANYLVKPVFFEHYYGKGELSDTILWVSSCYAMKTNELEEALKTSKCPALAGVDGLNAAEYDIHMQDTAVNYMMHGSTFYDALTSAITDLNNQGENPAEGVNLKFLGEKTTSLFTLTDEAAQELEEAKVKEGKVTIKLEYEDGTPASARIDITSENGQEGFGFSNVEGSETLTLEEGTYTIEVGIDGEKITSTFEVKFEIDANGDTKDLVLPPIIIESPENYTDIVNAAYESCSVWVKDMTTEHGATDDFYFWFQDVNMDGKTDFVVGPAITGAHACHNFVVWEEKNGKLEKSSRYYSDGYMTNDILMWHNYGSDMDFKRPASSADSFYLNLYKNNGKYVYIYPSSDGDASSTVMLISSISCPGGAITEEFRIDRMASGDSYYIKNKKVSAEQFKKDYESYCRNLTPVNTYTEKLSYNELKTATEKEWKEKLQSSYETWATKDSSGDVNLGFDSYVAKMKDEPEPTASDDDECPLFVGMVDTEKDPLNVRESPSKNAKIIGQLEKGTLVDIYNEDDGWCEIRYEDKVGYVSKEYITAFVGGVAKPVIYLYPEKKQDVSVEVNFENGWFTCTYPDYGSGWNVTAYPDGRIINKADGDEYSYLYWEGSQAMELDFSEGFVVSREDTADFLKEKLSQMGLTPREYNEFIVYWLPIMQKNEYNLISFQWDNYDEAAKLEISPEPDSVLRVFMAFKAANENTDVPEQKLEKIERSGFTVVEWGGTEVK